MIWIGLIGGIAVGAVLWGFNGAIVLGFIGWLGGLILKSSRSKGAAPVSGPAAPVRPAVLEEAIETRVLRLEQTVKSLQSRLARLDPEPAPSPQPVAQAAAEVMPEPVLESVAEAAARELPPEEVPEPQPEAAAPQAIEPSAPNPIIAWLTGGNTIARVGLLILFIGFSFLLKYAADHSMLPVELRVAAVALGGIALLVVGWRLRDSRRGYALGLQGAGVAVLYLTTFAAFRLWNLLPPTAAFVLLAVIAVFSAVLAVRQDAMVLAAFGAGGGFLAPILASTGGGNHAALFSYYLLLNMGIAGIALYKAWRPLNLLGFLFTFVIGLAWGSKYYRPEYFDSVEPFLIAFFLLYVAIAILFARRQPPQLGHYVDGTLVFGVPLVAFGLQAALVRGTAMEEFGLAYSSLALSAFYLVLAATLRRAVKENYALLAETFLALGVVFATAAIPLALDARWTSASWAIEGAAIVWVGVRQRRTLARAFGLLLQLLAGGAFLNGFVRGYDPAPPLLDPAFVGALLLAIAGFWIYRLLRRAGGGVTKAESVIATWAFAWGMVWWFFAGSCEIALQVDPASRLEAEVGLLSATAIALAFAGLRRGWIEAAWSTRIFTPLLVVLALASVVSQSHPFANFGWIAWPVAIAVHFGILRAFDLEGAPRTRDTLHVLGVLLVAGLGAVELHWLATEYTAHHTAWSVAAAAFVPAWVMLVISMAAMDDRWPVSAAPIAHRTTANGVLVVCLVLWTVYANISHDGRSDPLPYLPLVNALDLMQVMAGFAVAHAWLALRRTGLEAPSGRIAAGLAGALAFLWLNGVLLRTLHHWADVPYNANGITSSTLAQASLSVFWSVLALALMVVATRMGRRVLWAVGAALMGVVVVKLFLIDLSHVGGIARIVSFIAIGLLMLVIGYVSPVPPRRAEEKP